MSGIAVAVTTYLSTQGAEEAAESQVEATERAQDISQAAAEQARLDVQSSIDPAKAELSGGITDAISALRSGQVGELSALKDAAWQQSGAIRSGTTTGIDTLRRAQSQGLGAVRSGIGTARGDISSGMRAGMQSLSPYADVGQQALQQEAALTGALGPEAQAQALQAFSESPGQKYLREKQEQALLRNSAALGGLGGGNVRTALQEQAFGIAATDQQRALENLRSLSGAGQQASTTQAGIQTQGAQSLAQLAAQQGITEADLIAQMQGGIAGQQIAQGQQLSDIYGQSGANIAQILGTDKANIANLLAQRGAGLSGITQQGGTTLANIAVGQGTQQAQLAQDIGSAQAAGQLGTAQAYSNVLTNILGFGGQTAGYAAGRYR